MEINHSTEKLSLLIAYLSCIGVWFAIPSVSLIINRDDRWPIALTILLIIFIFFIVSYILQWKVLFPDTAVKQVYTYNDEVI